MARKTASRLSKRREAEAAEAAEDAEEKPKKKVTRKKAATRSRAKKDTIERRELIWAVFSATMKEEARFKYTEKKLAEEKLEALRAKSKKTYFMQPIKELITTKLPEEIAAEEEKAAKKKAAAEKKAAAAERKAAKLAAKAEKEAAGTTKKAAKKKTTKKAAKKKK